MRKALVLVATLLVLSLVSASFLSPKVFLDLSTSVHSWILDQMGWLYSTVALGMVLLVLLIWISPLGKIRIGGQDAIPTLTRWRWFTIGLCTTIAVGILFWACAEPLYHAHAPASRWMVDADSAAARHKALSTLYLHWTFTPYAIYTIPAIVFALSFYNLGSRFSLSGIASPVIGKSMARRIGGGLDILCLIALVAGMAASLGTGIFSLVGGLSRLTGEIPKTPVVLFIVAAAVVFCFVLSSVSGVMKGIRILSDWNTRFFVLLLVVVALWGPTQDVWRMSLPAVAEYGRSFFGMSLYWGGSQDTWPRSWSMFYWSNWMAWAPITAMFLAKISYGRSIREFIFFLWFCPSLFGFVWMSLFGGSSLALDLASGGEFWRTIQTQGPEAAVYLVLGSLPLPELMTGVFVFITFLSYVTAADSNTDAMASLSYHQSSLAERAGGKAGLKIFWGGLVGLVAWVMISFSGIDGVRMLSNLGGLPALVVMLLASASAFRWLLFGLRPK